MNDSLHTNDPEAGTEGDISASPADTLKEDVIAAIRECYDPEIPVNIYDLAKQMILHSGLKIKDDNNKDGDIQIKITGLRPGEKLYEELLIDDNSLPTIHPKIYKAYEKTVPKEKLFQLLNDLEKYINAYDIPKTLKLLSELVPDWKGGGELIKRL